MLRWPMEAPVQAKGFAYEVEHDFEHGVWCKGVWVLDACA